MVLAQRRADVSEALVVFTCIAGGYDELPPVRAPEPGVRYVCFSDGSVAPADGWEMRPLPRDFASAALANRYVKMHPHVLFPEFALSVYVDGNMAFGPGVKALADRALADHDMAAYGHPFRDCVYEESVECAAVGHDWIWNYERHVNRYRREGMPAKLGMFECNILLRRHNAPAVVALMEAWWLEYTRGAKRDQLSFPYVLWRLPVRLNNLGQSGIRSGIGMFRLHANHRSDGRLRQLRGYANRALPPFWLAARRTGWKPR